jgi:hypothetical protein
MNMPTFTAEASLYKTSGQYYTAYDIASSSGNVISALFQNPLRTPLSGGRVFEDFPERCQLGCWLGCVYRDKNPKHICDLHCGCLG